MEEQLFKGILEKSDSLIITVLCIWVLFKIIFKIFDYKTVVTNKKIEKAQKERSEKSEKEQQERYDQVVEFMEDISALAKNSETKDKILESIEYKLKIIYTQYGSELSKEAAIAIIQNFYFVYATIIANEIYKLQKEHYPFDVVKNKLKNISSIICDDKMQELNLFTYRNRVLVTYTPGNILNDQTIVDIMTGFAEKNGLLREEIENAVSMEAANVIKRF